MMLCLISLAVEATLFNANRLAVVKAAELCTVKRNITAPPEFEITADIQT